MRKIIVQMMITLDGFVCGTDGELDWIDFDPELGKAHFKLASEADAALIGHGVYADMASYWPQAETDPQNSADEAAFAKVVNDMKKLVVSTRTEELGWKNAEQLLGADEAELVQKLQDLKNQDGGYLLAYGGVQTAQTLLKHGLVDELRLDVCPLALGEGKRLFTARTKLKLVDSVRYESGAMTLTYRPVAAVSEADAIANGAKGTQDAHAPGVQSGSASGAEPVEFGSWAKILVVEDNPAIAEVYQKRMEMIGYICFVAHEGNEALAVMEKERPSLVLLDLMVPGVAGDQILRRMRASDWGRDIKVLVISNLNEEDAPAGLRSQGIEGYAVKANLTDDQLDQMVNEIFERTGERPQA
jgi:CheY-like chemotaxis protein